MANGFDTTQESYVGDDPTGIGYDEGSTNILVLVVLVMEVQT